MTDLDQFREQTRAWLEANCPPEMREPIRGDQDVCWGGRHYDPAANPAQAQWLKVMGERGWTVPDWPKEYGGGGLSPAETKVLREEMRAIRARNPLNSFGISMLGPALLKYGSQEQKLEHLPKIARGEIRWCQGYSEPNAGSDLAGLRTSARVEGDMLVITGHKIWTTSAYDATHMFALVRTYAGSVRQAGISFVLLAMDQPGITVRDIRNIAGEVEFCEVFMDNARTPLANIVGPMNDGWRIAKSLLGFERVWAGSPRKALAALWRTEALARDPHSALAQDPAFIDRLTQMRLDVQDLQSLYQRFAQLLRQGELGPEVSALKVWATETSQLASELLLEASAGNGMLQGGEALTAFYDTRAPSIFSGTNQIQRNLIARNVLNLPGKS